MKKCFLDDVAEDDELVEIEASDEVEEPAEVDEIARTEVEKRFAVGVPVPLIARNGCYPFIST